MELSDFELIRGIQHGDQSALDLLVRRWYPRVYRYCVKLTGNEQDSYDLTQDVFVAVLQNLSKYHPWKPFHSWLFTIAYHKCMDHFRMQAHLLTTEYDFSEREDPLGSPEVQTEITLPVREALARLPVQQRNAVIWHYLYGMTAIEISNVTKTPLPTIKSRLASGKKKLRKELQEVFR